MRNNFRVRRSDGVTSTFPRPWAAERVFDGAELEPGDVIFLERWSRWKKQWREIRRRAWTPTPHDAP
jgi:hypothetical protein